LTIPFGRTGRGLGVMVAVLFGAGLLFAPGAESSTSTYITPSGSTAGGQPVSATATFVTSNDDIKITLTNLQSNPTSVVQNLSDLTFTLSTGQTSGTLLSSSGLERTVNANGTFSNGGTVATGWLLEAGLHLNDLAGGGAGPAHTLIGGPDGSSVYSNANNSIAGNVPHNPFLAGTISFDIQVIGVTAATLVNGVIFSFGTTPGVEVTGTPRVPEPATALLLGSGLLIVGALRWRRRR